MQSAEHAWALLTTAYNCSMRQHVVPLLKTSCFCFCCLGCILTLLLPLLRSLASAEHPAQQPYHNPERLNGVLQLLGRQAYCSISGNAQPALLLRTDQDRCCPDS